MYNPQSIPNPKFDLVFCHESQDLPVSPAPPFSPKKHTASMDLTNHLSHTSF